MVHPRQLISFITRTSQFLTRQQEHPADSPGHPQAFGEDGPDPVQDPNGDTLPYRELPFPTDEIPAVELPTSISDEPEPEDESEPVADPGLVDEPEPEDESEPVAGPGPVDEPEPEDESEPVADPGLVDEPGNDQNDPTFPADTEEENRVPKDDDSPSSTSGERRLAGQAACEQLETLSSSLNRLCRESDPQFVRVGRDLTIVTGDVRKLTNTVHQAVSLIQNSQEEEASLQKTENLVQEVFATLSEDRQLIDKDVVHVNNLVTQIFQCDRIKDMIDRINSLFRIVRINIRIQCSAQSISEEMFEGVSEDLDHLAKKLHNVTRQILRDIKLGAKSLTSLQKAINDHLKHMDMVFQETKAVVSRAFYDIKQVMYGTEKMISEADTRSRLVSEKVGEIVVSVQFHDSLSQRVEHIIHAFEDICELCDGRSSELTEQHLGTAFIILDLQHRQLLQISKEIKLVRERIEADFHVIESEVNGLGSILHDTQFRQVGPQQFLGSLFSQLERTLTSLHPLLAEGEDMVSQIEYAAGETRIIANNLAELKESVTEIREETRVQAVNTIIMASTLGHKGKTIEVLAKEIQTLSDRSSVLADDVEALQLAVSQAIDELIVNKTGSNRRLNENVFEEEIGTIKNSFGRIMDIVTEITRQIENSGTHIQTARSALQFLDTLELKLDSILHNLSGTLSRLAKWKGRGTHDTEEIKQLKLRYSMAQERMIHMFDRVDETKASEDEDEIFF